MFIIDEYNEKINNFYDLMQSNKNIVDIRVSEDKWTLKEMVSHLIDSASNNHQRFIRLQIENEINFPAYDAEKWKAHSKISEFGFIELINLWKGYNYFLLHLIKNIEVKNYNNKWISTDKEITLKSIVEDYFGRHMDWHIELYKNRIEEINKMENMVSDKSHVVTN